MLLWRGASGVCLLAKLGVADLEGHLGGDQVARQHRHLEGSEKTRGCGGLLPLAPARAARPMADEERLGLIPKHREDHAGR